ncbi:S41 family peptidase [Veillonella intestinalis]|uniref:S41 family peptidase n=1 Tax=Veillonella intestinalis TaxID=2941341 RepID=UPI00203AA21E|nr:S41 family peptidase [Veillonella intestinalis]
MKNNFLKGWLPGSLKSGIQFAIKFTVAGLVFLWLVFWYISGSPAGAIKFFFTYFVASHFYMEPVAKTTLFEGSLAGMVDSLGEPHSQFLNEKAFNDIYMQTSGSYSGVGIVLGQDKEGLMKVATAIEGQPAATAGIKSGDIIVAIDGIKTSTLAMEDASKMIRGEEGTQVVLSVMRDNEIKEFTITRQQISLPTVKGKMLDNHIGYIRISQFAEPTGPDFANIYNELKEKGMTKLVLDLRDNPGGLLTTAQEVSDYILPAGPIVTIQDRSGRIESYDSKGLMPTIPLVVLINQGSASASEIIAGAVQDEKVGTIVGTNSYGKGTVQTVLSMLGDEGIKITIAKYHTPNDRVIDGTGIKPDVEVSLPEGASSEADDTQLKKAIEILMTK